MIKRLVKKIIIAVAVLTLALILSIASCQKGSGIVGKINSDKLANTYVPNKNEDESVNYAGDAGGIILPISKKPIEIEYMFYEHPNNPVKKDWLVFTELEKRTNIKYKLQYYSEEFYPKLNLLVSTRQLPDLINANNKLAKRYRTEEILIPINKYLDMMPNFKKLLNENPKLKNDITEEDGNIYICPWYGAERIMNIWLYRRDLFRKNNLETPKNFDEFYRLCKEIKTIYPDSYPFTHRQKEYILKELGPSFGTGFLTYFDVEKDEYRYGATDDNFKQMLMFLNKLHCEGLMDTEWATQNTSQWEVKIVTSKSLITFDYIDRIYVFNNVMKEREPDFDLFTFLPLKTESGCPQVYGRYELGTEYHGFMISSNNKYPEETAKLIDYLYSEQGAILVTFGIEDKTYYKDNDGRYIWAEDINSEIHPEGKKHHTNDFGFLAIGTYAWSMDTSYLVNSKEWNEAKDMYERNNSILPPPPLLSFNEQEIRIQKNADLLDDYVQKQSMYFILGDRKFSEWDDYVKEVERYGYRELIETYNDVYTRYKTNMKK